MLFELFLVKVHAYFMLRKEIRAEHYNCSI